MRTTKDNLRACRWVALAVLLPIVAWASPGDYAVLHEFASGAQDGAVPLSSVAESGGRLFGMTTLGGASNLGVVFAVNSDGSAYTNLHAFGGIDGRHPLGSLLARGADLYGMTTRGGSNNAGVVFTIRTNGTGYSVLHHFDAADENDGAMPWGAPVEAGGVLYGMTYNGGRTNGGVVFALATDGSGYTNLHRFAGGAGDGRHPKGDLVADGGRLYGVASEGGRRNAGVVFALGQDGSGYTNLHEFTGQAGDGMNPGGSLILDGSYLYGTAEPGDDNSGVVFCISTNGGSLNYLWFFDGAADDGASPVAGLCKHGSKLYGVTRYGGANSRGVLYALGGSASNQYMWTAGGEPIGGLMAAGDTVYGTTLRGGGGQAGTLYSFELITNDSPAAWCAMTWIENGQLADVLAGDMPGDRMWIRHSTGGGMPEHAYVGYGGTAGFDDTSWTWVPMTEYGIVNGGSDFEFTGRFSRASAGDYVVAAKFIKGRHVYYTTGLGAWGDWSTALYATNRWTVDALTAPRNAYARFMSTDRIDVSFTNDGTHWVTVFRKAGAAPVFAAPEDGTEYFNGTVYSDQGECIYRGSTNLLDDSPLDAGTIYAYRLYTENYTFYSTGSLASASTDAARDDDSDGMPNGWEHDNGLDPGLVADGADDADDDGMPNRDEYVAGTIPTDDESLLEVVQADAEAVADGVVLTWTSVDGKAYTIWRTEDLLAGFNEAVVSNLTATAPMNSYTDTVAGVEARHYRIEVQQ